MNLKANKFNNNLLDLTIKYIFVVEFKRSMYIMNIDNGNKLNQLLQYWQPGGLLFSAWLNKNGYSAQLIQQYRRSGWFSMLTRGVMYRSGDKLSTYVAISSYNTQLNKKFYVGAHSALELSGFNHYVPMGKPVLMIGYPIHENIPNWLLCAKFENELKFFSTKTFLNPQLTSINKENCEILTSVPEQAFLECLMLAPSQYAYIDLFYIMEQLTALRAEVVQQLLEDTDNIKIKRLFLYMAKKSGHDWFNRLDKSKIELGTGKYKLADNGVYIPEYMMTIPKELYEYE